MHEGDLTHDEINAAIGEAEKTIIFARQNRLRDGVLLADDKLPRFHAGHDNVRFFYSAVRQLPEFFLDALLARDISVTLVVGTGMLCFRDMRNWCAVHTGRTRRTIYLPERILEVAFNNGYDYWSIAHILVTQGWKLLDFVLLQEMVEAVRQRVLDGGTTVVGHSTFRQFLRRRNRHRSSYESPELREWRKKCGMEDAPINEEEAFTKLYEPKFVQGLSAILARSDGAAISAIGAYSLGLDREEATERILELRQDGADALSSDAVAKLLYDEYEEETWGTQKSEELFEELGFPDFFLLDRDILHPAAKEMAAAAGQETEPQNMDEARHDYRDCMRFGISTSFGREKLLELAPGFGADGILGLMDEIVSPLFEKAEIDKVLAEAARSVGAHASKPSDFTIHLGRGLDLVRLRDLLEFWRAVGVGDRILRLQDVDTVKRVGILISAARTKAFDTTVMQVIDEADTIHKLIMTATSPPSASPALRGLIVGEVHRLFDDNLAADDRTPTIPDRLAVFQHLTTKLDAPAREPDERPGVTIWRLLDEQLEMAVVQATLCLDLLPEYPREVARLVQRGEIGRRMVSEYVERVEGRAAEGADVSEQEIVVSRARRALTGDPADPDSAHDEDETLVGIVARVDGLLARIPDRFHACTSGKVSPIRKAMKELQDLRRRHPTSPELLGLLTMVLVRLDRTADYDELLDEVRSLGQHAVGEVLWRRPGWRFPRRTPGLLKLADEGDFDEVALEMAEQISGKSRTQLLEPRLVFQGD
ncbi:MAG TPA: hypothetical protein QGF95_03345 [Candidatus Latescibacteria bacterium]|jgi:hypothetical protein|nr:hypothetical protein [Candidatus Latescibacterota bacterium]